jgi:glycosidase
MPNSIFDPAVNSLFAQARSGQLSLFPSPEDWRDTPIYFLMVDRFNNDAAPFKGGGTWDSLYTQYRGGTFNGITSKLQYIKEMGFGAIWLSPVFKNFPADNTYHGYGIQDFLALDPHFASAPGQEEAEFQKLVNTAHNLELYIILDIVLHHTAEVFKYAIPNGAGGTDDLDIINWTNSQQNVHWRNADGSANSGWSSGPANPPIDAAVWPSELRDNNLFVRQGQYDSPGGQLQGDFYSFRGINFFANASLTPQSILIRSYQYIIAKFDIDAFRIDTLMFIPPDFERTFGNAVREFALSVGKKNFFTFGEVTSDDTTIDKFIGRDTITPNDPVGVDAVVDYPLFGVLPGMAKGLGPTPAQVAQLFQDRKVAEESILTSHGEAGQYFVTFLDNHDQTQRFGYTGSTQNIDQITLGLGCLLTLPGIPCVYYGTEQGLSAHGPDTAPHDIVREALWGKLNAFDATSAIYSAIQKILAQRGAHAALRYGRYYFRPVSGDHTSFGLSKFQTGVFAFSRILNDAEILIAANTDATTPFPGDILIDATLNTPGTPYNVLYSNQSNPKTGVVAQRQNTNLTQPDGSTSSGSATVLPVTLRPREFQILSA